MKFEFTKTGGEVVQLSIPQLLHQKLELMWERSNKYKNDNLIIIDGDTGTGKSNLATLISADFSNLSGRTYDVSNVFFDSNQMVKFALNTQEQIIHYDESLFSAMASDWQTQEQKKLIKMLWLCRKKKHFFVFCLPDFFSLRDKIAVEKSVALVRTYLSNGLEPGSFAYYTKDQKSLLFSLWKKKGQKGYRKYYAFNATFSPVLHKIIDEEAYERKKDMAIMSLDKEEKPKESKEAKELARLKQKIYESSFKFNLNQEAVAEHFGTTARTVRKWKIPSENDQISKENEVLEVSEVGNILNNSPYTIKTINNPVLSFQEHPDQAERALIVQTDKENDLTDQEVVKLTEGDTDNKGQKNEIEKF